MEPIQALILGILLAYWPIIGFLTWGWANYMLSAQDSEKGDWLPLRHGALMLFLVSGPISLFCFMFGASMDRVKFKAGLRFN